MTGLRGITNGTKIDMGTNDKNSHNRNFTDKKRSYVEILLASQV